MALVVDPSEMSVLELAKTRSVLLKFAKELDESPALKRSEIDVSVFSMSKMSLYLHEPISVRERDYLSQVLGQSLPVFDVKSELLSSIGYLFRTFNASANNMIFIVTKSAGRIFDYKEWYYAALVDRYVSPMKNAGAYLFVMELDERPLGRAFLFSDPQCAFNIRYDRHDEFESMIETIEHLACQREIFSRNCNSRRRDDSCVLGEIGERTSVTCHKKPTEPGHLFPFDPLEYESRELRSLVHLQVQNSNFSRLEAAFLKNVSLPALEDLVMRCNSIETVNGSFFALTPNLKSLNLGYNSIQSVGGFFGDLEKVQSLILIHNSITKLERDDFVGLKELIYLDFEHNQIVEMDDDCFRDLAALKNLTIMENNLTRLTSHVFRPLVSLEYLLLGKNQIAEIDEDAFVNNGKLICIVLDENQMEYLSAGLFRSQVNLRWILMSKNWLKIIAPETFAPLALLEWVDLSDNYLNSNNLPVFNSSTFFSLNLENQHDELLSLDESFFSRNFIRASKRLIVSAYNNTIRVIRRDMTHSVLDSLDIFAFSISLESFIESVRADFCNLKFYSLGQNKVAIIFLENIDKVPKDSEYLRLLMRNCQLRLQIARFNLVFLSIRFPPYSSVCANYDYRKLETC